MWHWIQTSLTSQGLYFIRRLSRVERSLGVQPSGTPDPSLLSNFKRLSSLIRSSIVLLQVLTSLTTRCKNLWTFYQKGRFPLKDFLRGQWNMQCDSIFSHLVGTIQVMQVSIHSEGTHMTAPSTVKQIALKDMRLKWFSFVTEFMDLVIPSGCWLERNLFPETSEYSLE